MRGFVGDDQALYVVVRVVGKAAQLVRCIRLTSGCFYSLPLLFTVNSIVLHCVTLGSVVGAIVCSVNVGQ